jgi:hypothetical protein
MPGALQIHDRDKRLQCTFQNLNPDYVATDSLMNLERTLSFDNGIGSCSHSFFVTWGPLRQSECSKTNGKTLKWIVLCSSHNALPVRVDSPTSDGAEQPFATAQVNAAALTTAGTGVHLACTHLEST